MARESSTIEQVRKAQDLFKQGIDFHEAKEYKEAISVFKKCTLINPFQKGHLEELGKRLKQGSYKLLQESVAYMGCAAVHLHGLVAELTDDQRDTVPVDEKLIEVFKDWDLSS
tara:strand:+ start:556 stop:894 length:339 start_codon:yes stop_codon:yes gene_type:complete